MTTGIFACCEISVEAREHLHLLAQHQFFRELLGAIRPLARNVAINELDFGFLAVRSLHGLAVDGLIGVDGLLELCAPRSESAREVGDQTDLEDIRRGDTA